MKTGRPLKFKTPEELQQKINEYFNITPNEEVTITGLALHLDTSRETLMNYEDREEFFDTIKRAKDKVQLEYELDLRRKGRSGDIFALKNFGWVDKQELDFYKKEQQYTDEELQSIINRSTNSSQRTCEKTEGGEV